MQTVVCSLTDLLICSSCCLQVVSLLLIQGADPNARDNWNYTPLHEAAIKGKIDVCIGERALTACFSCPGALKSKTQWDQNLLDGQSFWLTLIFIEKKLIIGHQLEQETFLNASNKCCFIINIDTWKI